jgi:hypothetical protein
MECHVWAGYPSSNFRSPLYIQYPSQYLVFIPETSPQTTSAFAICKVNGNRKGRIEEIKQKGKELSKLFSFWA